MNIRRVRYSDSVENHSGHYHDCHQFIYIKSGDAVVSVDGNEYAVSDGTLVILNRLESHSVAVKSKNYERFVLHIYPDGIDDYGIYPLVIYRGRGFNRVPIINQKQDIENLLYKMTEEYSAQNNMYENMLDLLFRQFVIILKRSNPELFENTASQKDILVRTIQQRFEKDCAQKYTLDGLCCDYHISKSHLSHLFKEVTGYAPMEYLNVYRMTYAKKLLVSTSYSVTDIVEMCGFSDESNFSRTFKTREGITPTGFRNKYI